MYKELKGKNLAILLVIVVVAFAVIFLLVQKNPPLQQEEVVQGTETNFYGISGKILEVRDGEIVVETAAIPYEGVRVDENAKWIWVVVLQENTVFETLERYEGEVTKEAALSDNLYKRTLVGAEALQVGQFIALQGSEEIQTQFSSSEKRTRASIIQIYSGL